MFQNSECLERAHQFLLVDGSCCSVVEVSELFLVITFWIPSAKFFCFFFSPPKYPDTSWMPAIKFCVDYPELTHTREEKGSVPPDLPPLEMLVTCTVH